jgi:hypothetical protein
MSYTTDVLLYVGHSGDKGLEPFLEALMANDERYGATLLPLDTDAANGPRSFGGAVLAQGGNHFPTWDMQGILDGVRWSSPGDVVLICATEDKITQVFRPTFVEEYSGYYDSEVRAVQPVTQAES